MEYDGKTLRVPGRPGACVGCPMSQYRWPWASAAVKQYFPNWSTMQAGAIWCQVAKCQFKEFQMALSGLEIYGYFPRPIAKTVDFPLSRFAMKLAQKQASWLASARQ